MATDHDFIEYVCEQVGTTGIVTYKKMFGEYMVYINARPILLVCDNTVYVKILDCIKDLMAEAEIGTPYPGAKPHYILDIDNSALSCEAVRILEPVTLLPKPRKRKD
jgi:TfoX/Sxy family transcriptional regulator of competence genes